MPAVASILDSHPKLPELDTQLHADTLDALWEAARAARMCADACLHETDDLRQCIAFDLDVADLATATAGLVVRMNDPEVIRDALHASSTALSAAAQESRAHAHLRHCAICAHACERAEELCRRLEVAVQRMVERAGPPRRNNSAARPPDPVGTGRFEVPADLDITASRTGRPPIHLMTGGDLGDGAD